MNICASQEKIAFHWIIFVMELLIAKTMMMKLTVIGKGIKKNLDFWFFNSHIVSFEYCTVKKAKIFRFFEVNSDSRLKLG